MNVFCMHLCTQGQTELGLNVIKAKKEALSKRIKQYKRLDLFFKWAWVFFLCN